MKLQDLIKQVYYEPSIIMPDAHASIRQLLESRLESGNGFVREPGRGGLCGEKVAVEQMEIEDGVAYIPVGGAIGQKLTPFERGDGCVDVIDVMEELDFAEESKEVQMAILDIDSPGGMFTGTPELADRIEQFEKPIYAFSNGMIASAAYWIAAACDGIFTTRSAYVGSVGVYLPVIDDTGFYAQKGIKIELIKAGKLKGIGFPGIALSESAREHLQKRVNDIYAMFTGHVRARRGDSVAEDTMQGQVFMGPEAMERGLIDGLVKGIGEVAELA